MTFGELFAGIGGFSLGLERAGMKCKWQVEIDPYATAVLRKHWPDVPKHDDVRTFPPHTHTHTITASISSAADSPAKTSARQGRNQDCLENAVDYGASTPESLANYDRDTSSWRTSQRSLLEEWTQFSGRFPRSGMTLNGTAYLLPTLAPRLDAKVVIGSGLWPTPTAGDALGRGYHGRLSGNWWPSLAGAVSLAEGDAVQCVTAGRVSPQFVEWLMGFPLGWTALDASETPSSRKSSKSSGGRSLKRKRG